jgi:HAD superfamily hydrolase (TIGR01509 family)
MAMFKALLFDMDGLIFDTEALYKISWQYAAETMGFDLTDEFYQRFIGVQDPDCERMLAEHFGEGFDLAEYRTIRDAHYHEARKAGIAFKEGFHTLFAEAKSQQLTIALVTSSALPETKLNFGNTDYLNQFDLVITAEDVANGKPEPDCYVMAHEKLGLSAKDCLVLEDSNNGMRSGKAAGCYAAMIPDIVPPHQDVVESADYIFDSLDQVTALLISQK